MEIKCQLDATEVFIADLIACSTCFGHHYAHHQELKIITQWLLPVVFRAVVFKLLVWCGAEGYVSGLQDAAVGLCVRFAGCLLVYSIFNNNFIHAKRTHAYAKPSQYIENTHGCSLNVKNYNLH